MNKRSKKIIRVSILGIIVNLALAGFKVFVGLLSNSIAIILDAINNFSDSLSSIVTIIGTAFANKAPDRDHPMGHGRAEYLSTVIIGMLIVYIGFTALVESVKKIITPEPVSYQTATIVVMAVAVVAKIALGLYVRHRGKKLESTALVGSGIDALYDAIISAATLVAIIVFFISGVLVEPYLAAAISLFILRSGVNLIREAFSTILGERADSRLTRRIKTEITRINGVNGAFDLVIHDYGNGYVLASVNIEVDCRLSASEIDDLSREIQKTIYKKYHIIINSVGIYAIDMRDVTIEKLWRIVKGIAEEYDRILEIHGFHVDLRDHEISFDTVIDYTTKDRSAYFQKFTREVEEAIPDFKISIVLDADISD